MATFCNLIRIIPLNNSLITRTASVRANAAITKLPSSAARTFTNLSRVGHQSKLTSTEAGQCSNLQLQRYHSEVPIPPDTTENVIDLMDVPVERFLGGRSIFNGIFGWMAIRTAIRSVDPEFDTKDFVRGAAQAIETVSHRLANQEYDGLEGLVTPKAIEILKENIAKMTEVQRGKIAVKREDFQRIFWSEIKLREDKAVDPPKRFVEISVKFEALASKPRDVAEFKKFM